MESLTIGTVSDAELREASRGFTLMLRRKRFSSEWIEANAADLLAQAQNEYAARLAKGEPARNPVGWLITCAWRRAQNLLDSERRKPRPFSLDMAFHHVDESIPTPEEVVLDADRQERLRKALRHLPEKECRLIALVYFEDHTIREAGRKLGWQKSAADRHHRAAMERLHALVGDRSLLSPASLGLGAWVVAATEGRRPGIAGAGVLEEGVAVLSHRLTELWRRVSPLAEPGNVATSGGAARAAGYCGAAGVAVVCGLATGVVGPQVRADVPKPPPSRAIERSAPAPVTSPQPKAIPRETASSREAEGRTIKTRSSEQQRDADKRTRTAQAPQASTRQTITEFGVEGSTGPAPDHTSSPSGSSQSSSLGSSAPASQPRSAPNASGGQKSSGGEFGF